MLCLSGTPTRRRTSPRLKQSRGKWHASSSAGSGTPQVSTACWRHWAGLLWSNDSFADSWYSTKSRVALHSAPPWKPNWSPSHHINDTPMTNSSPCWPPEHSDSVEYYRGSSFLPKNIRDWNSLPMVVVEAPTLDAFVSRVSNWTITYSIPPSPKPLPCSWLKKKFLKKCRTSTTANTPSYRHQNNWHDIVGP